MPSARIWRCAKQNFAGSAASSALPPRVLQEGVLTPGTRHVFSFLLVPHYAPWQGLKPNPRV